MFMQLLRILVWIAIALFVIYWLVRLNDYVKDDRDITIYDVHRTECCVYNCPNKADLFAKGFYCVVHYQEKIRNDGYREMSGDEL